MLAIGSLQIQPTISLMTSFPSLRGRMDLGCEAKLKPASSPARRLPSPVMAIGAQRRHLLHQDAGQVLHGVFGYPLIGGLGAAYKKFAARDIEETPMILLKGALLELCTVRALTDIERARPEPFNRHGTQHGDRRFFSKANALTGLLLLAGWIREFTWIAENHPDVLYNDPE